ncbi:MAG: GNAT family N-acetyltransferase [Kiloniellales bacterium]|nr:GNAT family N-acetyltransferase [Kiloniellales bacterium]
MSGWKPGEPLEIETERFRLRSLRPEDANERLLAWLNDPNLMAYLGGAWASKTVEALAESIGKLYDNKSNFMLGVYDGEHLIGCYWIEAYLRLRSAVTHHLFGDRDYWGRGAPLECRAALLDWLFSVGFERVEGRPYATCIRAIRGYMKQGWRLEGIARRASRDRAGDRHDNMLFAMLPEEWAALRRAAKAADKAR